MSTKAIVTGATGFVGRWLVRELYRQSYDVTVIVRNRSTVPDEWKNKIEVIECPMENYKNMGKEDFSHTQYDLFFHFAWAGTSGGERASYDLQLRNVYAACEALNLAKRIGCGCFINAGSIMEYDAMKYIPVDAVRPSAGYMYSIAKQTADFMLKTLAAQEDIGYINVIISNIYGAGERSERFLNQLLRKMMTHQRIPLTNCDQLYDFIYVTDAVKAIIYAAQNGKSNYSYYIGNARQQPLKNYVLQAKEILGSGSELAFGEVPFNGVMLTYKEFETGTLYDMGFAAEVPFDEGIILTAGWIKEEDSMHGF